MVSLRVYIMEFHALACAAFKESVDFHSKLASLLWYVLNPTQRLVNTDALFQHVYREDLDFR